MRTKLLIAICLLAISRAAMPQKPAPVLFFTDLISGPNIGGQDVGGYAGAYVTLYGNFFGESRGESSVTLGRSNCLRVVSWGTPWMWYQKLVVQLGRECASGDLIVTVNGVASNSLPFSVSGGHIYFVSTAGSDSRNGSFSSPWKTLQHARSKMKDGDITYAEDGITANADDGEGWGAAYTLRAAWCGKGSEDVAPRALIAYPGARVTLGNVTKTMSIRVAGDGCPGHLVFAGLALRGLDVAVDITGPNPPILRGLRFVGNDVSCPNGNNQTGCLVGGFTDGVTILGNHIHDVGTNLDPRKVTNLYHAVYFGSTNHLELGWNTIANVYGCRGIQIYASGSILQYGIRIHHDLIHDTQCDGIALYTVDPKLGPVEVYNNVIYNAGKGPQSGDGGDWACLLVTGDNHPTGGSVKVYSNTMYNCGSFAHPPYPSVGGIIAGGPAGFVEISNNIIYQLNPVASYVRDLSRNANAAFGSNNLFYGIGPPGKNGVDPTKLKNSLSADPKFVSSSAYDFHLLDGSPASRAGAISTPQATHDHDGLLRELPSAVGAYNLTFR
jgi:hypothetical protein